MLHLVFLLLLYFLPAIIGHDKSNATCILLFNLFLGWTGIGWIIALVWAISAERCPRVHMVAVPVAASRYCCRCGSAAIPGAHFCTGCGCTV